MKRSICTAAFASFIPLVLAASAARADVKIVSTVTMTGQTPRFGGPGGRGPAYPRTVTAYFQGGNSRTETKDGPVVLYSSKDGKTTILDPIRKTYFLMNGPMPPPGGPDGASASMSAGASLKLTSGIKTLAGAAAKEYTLTGSIKMSFDGPPPGGMMGGPGGGGMMGGPPPPDGGGGMGMMGGPPGGGFGGPPPDGGGPGRRGHGPMRAANATVKGDFWVSSKVILPSDSKDALLPLLREALPGAGPLLTPLAGAVAKTHGVPLLTKITLTPDMPSAPPSDQGDMSRPAPPVPTPTVATLTVTYVSTQTLDASLFAVPQGYTLAPSHPRGRRGPGMFPGGPPPGGMMGGPGGGGMMDGPPPPDGGGGMDDGPPPPGS